MEKIKLLRPLWNRKAGETMEVTKDAAAFALRKGYAEPIAEQIESIKPQFTQQNKAEMNRVKTNAMQIKEEITGTEPISSTEAKSWLKVDFSTDDTLINMLITAVREAAERYTGLALIAKTIEYFDEAPDSIVKLPFPEHLEITELKINNVVTTGYLKTGLTQFIIDISPVFQSSTDNDNGLYVKYKTTGTCPTGLKALMLKEIDEQYRNRGNTFEGAIVDLSANFYASAAKYCLM